ncbi:fumarate reductase subunit FrdD [Alkalimonas collagenimarina]|uniref:Fumarate reductase subunit D n=1 Tax=Alkalimonas collagenimarina TaxID=400390 RepID=A0ABT9GYW2_9GAMM|nr:fumarate reductase subunit FrdD [Alkalimonas collagenimarina]MDP4536253.1 fumarate reductase subunit FrdD [Alkalimonas collagenimarina]
MSLTKRFQRSDEPIWWSLFSAGGVCVAMLIPALIVLLVFGPSLGLLSPDTLSYQRISTLLYHPLGLMFIGAVIILPLFHAMHRIHHGLHDLQWAHSALAKWLCYGSALLLSFLALSLWLLGR